MCKEKNGIETLERIEENKEFIIPLYQRNYKWNIKEVDKLINDFIKIYKYNKENKSNKTKSIGLITLHKREDNKYEVIDGQQRLITLAIIFNLLIDNENGKKIDLEFERDENEERKNALYAKNSENAAKKEISTDIDRINRNKGYIKKCLDDSHVDDYSDFANFILKNCTMLCSCIEQNPEAEFMNLNAYKTKFSVCDYVRANIISLNSFYKDELADKKSYLADALEKKSYKTAIAHLYNDILKILYKEDSKGEIGGRKTIFAYVLGEDPIKTLNPEDSNESRINFLFIDKKEENYYSDSIDEDSEYWIKMILKLACVKRILTQLQEEWDRGEFSSFKQIYDYHVLKKENFLRSNIIYSDKGEKEINVLTLSQILKKKSNVATILLADLKNVDQRLANRYMESFVNSKENKKTNTVVENFVLPEDEKEKGKVQLYTMPKEELFEEIQGVGRQVINRYIIEKRKSENTHVSIAPLIDLEDKENINFGGGLKLNDGEISVGKLFEYNICIPVIQRDYCMGYQITNDDNKEDFLHFLLKEFKDKESYEGEETLASTIVVAVQEDEKNIYIFDGQQRTYTLYNILKYIDEKIKDGKDEEKTEYKFLFIGRNDGENQEESPYSKKAVENLRNALDIRLENIDLKNLRKYLKNNVKFKVQVVSDISGAEQFFMDINGGVSLEKYEIFKSILYTHLKELDKEDIVKKIENEWLECFYKWRKAVDESDKPNEPDESDEEEILEMRCIEVVCRFIYNKKYPDSQWKTKDVFDIFKSKSELVAIESNYINNLDEEDIKNLYSMMNAIMIDIGKIDEGVAKVGVEEVQSAEGEKLKICIGQQDYMDKYIRIVSFFMKKETDIQDEAVLHSFIWSLYGKNREKLERYYEWKDKTIMDVYKGDRLLNVYLNRKLGTVVEDEYEYEEYKGMDKQINIIGGYHIGIVKICKMSSKDIPFYYAWEKIEKWYQEDKRDVKKIIRINEDYEKFCDEKGDKKVHYFAIEGDRGKINISNNYITSQDKESYISIGKNEYDNPTITIPINNGIEMEFGTWNAYLITTKALKNALKRIKDE